MSFSFFNLFSHKPSAKGSRNALHNPARIGNLLQHLLDDRSLLTIRIPGNDNAFISAVLAIDKANKTFSLDEISPTEGHTLFLKKKQLQVNGQSRGALFSFTLALQKQGQSRGIAFYEFAYPETVQYMQRRAYYRARLKADQRITVTTLHRESGTSISGYVIDISSHGISIMFNTERSISRGDKQTMCKLRLPDGQKIMFDLLVRHAQHLPNERILIGGNFENMNSRNAQLVTKFVRKLERASLRK